MFTSIYEKLACNDMKLWTNRRTFSANISTCLNPRFRHSGLSARLFQCIVKSIMQKALTDKIYRISLSSTYFFQYFSSYEPNKQKLFFKNFPWYVECLVWTVLCRPSGIRTVSPSHPDSLASSLGVLKM